MERRKEGIGKMRFFIPFLLLMIGTFFLMSAGASFAGTAKPLTDAELEKVVGGVTLPGDGAACNEVGTRNGCGIRDTRIIFWDEWIDRTNLIRGSEGFVGSGSNIIQNDTSR